MNMIEIERLVKRFGAVEAVDNVSFAAEKGKILVVLGPSGCGKSTVLRCIGGLEKPDAGTIRIRGEVVVDDTTFIAPEKRKLGMVHQSYAIWPHMTVFRNVAYPLRARKVPRNEWEHLVKDALGLVQLSELENRYPSQLSGGQQQRVALARAIVYKPEVLLLDEPLSNLDAKLREETRFDLMKLLHRLGITCIYVTHDQEEAMVIADIVAVMNKGKIQDIGTFGEIYATPKSEFLAAFIGKSNFLQGQVLNKSIGTIITYVVSLADGTKLTCRALQEELKPGQKVTVLIRPERMQVTEKRMDGSNILTGTLDSKVFVGNGFDCRLTISGHSLRALTTTLCDAEVGKDVYVSIDDAFVIPA